MTSQDIGLEARLKLHNEKDVYPFHMPGHKRQVDWLENPYNYDITEIEGFDNLYEASDVLAQIQQKAAALYGSEGAYLLVNGSTVGNLVAIFAATNQEDSIIIGRTCHKSVYHAAQLRQLRVAFTVPQVSRIGFVQQTSLAEYERAIQQNPDARAIVITSPTYEGILEDVSAIAQLAHLHGMRLIVDAAHGAHLGLDARDADLVIMSLHKTLPALTQTGLLHVCEADADLNNRVKQYLEMFQTSSPSYLLMTSIEKCLNFVDENGHQFEEYATRLANFYEGCQQLEKLRVEMYPYQDPSKIIIDASHTNITGTKLKQLLREKFNIELEMASFLYCLGMTSVMDGQEAFDRLLGALLEIDSALIACEEPNKVCFDKFFSAGQKVLEMHEVELEEHSWASIKEAAEKFAAGMVSIYPPAVPLLVPGEVITSEKIDIIKEAQKIGLIITGMRENQIQVVG